MKNVFLLSLIGILISISFVESNIRTLEDPKPEPDPLLATYKCVNNSKIDVGDTVYICLHIKEYGQRMLFKVEVDKYSILNFGGGYQLAHQMATNDSLLTKREEMNFIFQANDKFTKIPAVNKFIFIYFIIDLL